MAKLAVRVILDITISDEESGSPPSPVYDMQDEIENIISDGCGAEGFTYERLASNVVDDCRLDDVFEITEVP
jgi:hypothetical protein